MKNRLESRPARGATVPDSRLETVLARDVVLVLDSVDAQVHQLIAAHLTLADGVQDPDGRALLAAMTKVKVAALHLLVGGLSLVAEGVVLAPA